MSADPSTMQLILSAGADPDSLSISLCAAAGEGNPDVVTTLLAARANPYTAVEAAYMPESYTPLGWAVKGKAKGKGLGKSGKGEGKMDEDTKTRNYALVVKKLIEAKASPTEAGKGGNALGVAMEACEHFEVEWMSRGQVADFTGMVKALIEAGAISGGKGKSAFKGVAKGTMKGCKGQAKGKGKSEGIPPAAGVEILQALVEAGARYGKNDDILDHVVGDLTEMNRGINDEHGGQPPEEVKEARDAATEVLKQLILAKADVSQVKGKEDGLAEFFDEESKNTPSLKDVATMIRGCASTSPDTHGDLVAEVTKALGCDMDEFAGAGRDTMPDEGCEIQ